MSTYPQPVNEIEAIRVSFKELTFEGAEKLTKELLTLPIHPLMRSSDFEKIQRLIIHSLPSTPSRESRQPPPQNPH